jgi:hypothetical protein
LRRLGFNSAVELRPASLRDLLSKYGREDA